MTICLDNPGWSLQIDLKETAFENLICERVSIENTDVDWYSIEVINGQFIAAGDSFKLDFLIGEFKRITSNFLEQS